MAQSNMNCSSLPEWIDEISGQACQEFKRYLPLTQLAIHNYKDLFISEGWWLHEWATICPSKTVCGYTWSELAGGLSYAAGITIAVAVTVIVLATIFGIFFYYWRRKMLSSLSSYKPTGHPSINPVQYQPCPVTNHVR